MKIAIHNRPGSFSDRWIEYCQQKNIPYKLVYCYSSDIILQLADCNALMWHHSHDDYRDVLFAKQLLYSVQMAGKKIFPEFSTTWHFDDKIGQKYLLEAIGAPLVPSYVFYNKADAFNWIQSTTFPKVFKLRGGAGASNVRLVKTKKQALRLLRKAFGRGFSQFDRFAYLKERYRKYKEGKDSFWGVCKGLARLFMPTQFSKMHAREKGYVYFQDFIANNNFDVRLIVIKDKAYGLKRMVRKGDFRASGSSNFVYDAIDNTTLKLAFEITQKLNLQSAAFDFVYDESGAPLIIELSYGYGTSGSSKCMGYWTSDLIWHQDKFNPQGWMVENLIHTFEE